MNEPLLFWGVVGKDGRLIVVQDQPWCLTTYKPAAQWMAGPEGRRLGITNRHGPLSVKRFRVTWKDDEKAS